MNLRIAFKVTVALFLNDSVAEGEWKRTSSSDFTGSCLMDRLRASCCIVSEPFLCRGRKEMDRQSQRGCDVPVSCEGLAREGRHGECDVLTLFSSKVLPPFFCTSIPKQTRISPELPSLSSVLSLQSARVHLESAAPSHFP